MENRVIVICTLCLFIMTGCYPKVDPALIYTGSNEVTPDTITEAGREINENIASRIKERLDSSFIDYTKATHPVVYPSYYGGFYLNKRVKPVFVVVGDTAKIRKEFNKRIGSGNYTIQKGEYSSQQLDSLMKIITKKIAKGSLKFVYMAGIYTDINRIVVGLEKCSPRNIYRFKKDITDSGAVMFEEVTAVSI